MNPDWLAQVPEPDRSDLIAEYEERAAIREFEGGQARFRAEADAWKDVLQRYQRRQSEADGGECGGKG